ncbi:hypothetical protein QAD02_020123 [Eretmocerus hayati]|uniref:Uncharacterized protein n=1 Tax=Eretmocerus hayati TaxID=131215 RepID=A0ACC2PMS3_9HYME|nr:hypothetical protein QAD02_020123 [Eretmocerus hayati]
MENRRLIEARIKQLDKEYDDLKEISKDTNKKIAVNRESSICEAESHQPACDEDNFEFHNDQIINEVTGGSSSNSFHSVGNSSNEVGGPTTNKNATKAKKELNEREIRRRRDKTRNRVRKFRAKPENQAKKKRRAQIDQEHA